MKENGLISEKLDMKKTTISETKKTETKMTASTPDNCARYLWRVGLLLSEPMNEFWKTVNKMP